MDGMNVELLYKLLVGDLGFGRSGHFDRSNFAIMAFVCDGKLMFSDQVVTMVFCVLMGGIGMTTGR